MSLVILLLLSFGSKSNLALPIDLTGRSESSLQTSDGPSQRSLFTILWGCFSTTFVCAWVSVHPNIPPPEECGWRSLWDRFQLMIWMVIAPELILAWAGRQWFAAKRIADIYNEAKYPGIKKPSRLAKIANFIRQWVLGRKDMPDSGLWSRAHGHFVSMGGVVLVEPAANAETVNSKISEKAVVTHVDSSSSNQLKTSKAVPTEHILSLELLEQLVKRPDFHILITEDDIRDKSKRDFLSKLIVIIQSSWFIAQCIERGAYDLKVTELELVTLAVASLNAVMYFFWWDKPLDVKVPIKVYLNFRLDGSPQTAQDNLYFLEPPAQADDDAVSTLTTILSPADVQSRASAVFFRLSGLVLDMLKKPFEGGFLNSLYRWFILLPFYVLALVLFPFFFPFPFVIVFLIRFITPKPKPQLSSGNRGLLLTQIVGDLRTTRSQLTYFIDGAFDAWLNSISDVQGSLLSFLFGWFFVLPMFVFTLAILVLFVPVFVFFLLVFFVFTTMFTIFASSTVNPGDTHVHRFYSPKTESDRYSRMVIFAFFGVIFGGLHCLAWHFIYPTQVEQTLWRLTALTITVIPIIVAPIDYITNPIGGPSDSDGSNEVVEDNISVTNHGPASFIFSMDQSWKRRLVKKVLIYTLDFIMTVLLFVYVLARLSLIAQALALLRRQPPTAFMAVDWTKYIPHI